MENVQSRGWGKYIIYFTGRLISSRTIRAKSENHAKQVARNKFPHRRILHIVREGSNEISDKS